jgi:exonuclease SbcC
MIPIKLELRNFLAYRDPEPLDLSGLHVACLAGANGAGKSSLLDAITWALWGKARAHRDDELIHLGQTEMQVSLTFSLDGNLYRVTRYRSSKGTGRSLLSLEVKDGEQWLPRNEATIRDTQENINRLLRLDYQTFINSAFLVQGRADEFTRKTPAERKAILSEILGLDVWEQYEERAKQRLRQIDTERLQVEAEIREIDTELAREAEYRHGLDEAKHELMAIIEQVREAEARYNQLEQARLRYDAQRARCADLEQRLLQDEAERLRIAQEQQKLLERRAGFEEILASRQEIETGYAVLRAAQQQEQALSACLLEQNDLLQRQSKLQETISAIRGELVAQQRALLQQKAEQERIIREGECDEPLAETQSKLVVLEKRQSERDKWQRELSALNEERAALEATNRRLKIDIERIEAQLAQLTQSATPVCPLCGQELSESQRADLLERLEQERDEKRRARQSNYEQVEALRTEIGRLEKEIKAAEIELRNLPPLLDYAARLNERKSRADQARSEWEAVQAQLVELESILSTESYALAERAELAEVQAQMNNLGYDEAAHRAAHTAAQEYEIYETRKRELEQALQASPEIEEALARLDEQVSVWEQRLAEDRKALDQLEVEVKALEEQLVDFEQYRQELEYMRDKEGQARYNVGAAEQRLNALEQRRKRRADLIARQNQLGEKRAIYEELRLAFGKDGIPAMIIEAAIPEIEEEANQLLSYMTDGQMHIRFDTQREKVSGGIKETLDIRIADNLGTRDYETYSGGEAFRINFAIRLALSRLLARRAGAQLRTLVIDEGFGTQDAQGRERLVQAIRAVQDEFDLILAITHIDELKDAFPARIEVTKTPHGSVIELV